MLSSPAISGRAWREGAGGVPGIARLPRARERARPLREPRRAHIARDTLGCLQIEARVVRRVPRAGRDDDDALAHALVERRARETRAAIVEETDDVALADAARRRVARMDREPLAPGNFAAWATGPDSSGCAAGRAAGSSRGEADSARPPALEPLGGREPRGVSQTVVVTERRASAPSRARFSPTAFSARSPPGRRGKPRTARTVARVGAPPARSRICPSLASRSACGRGLAHAVPDPAQPLHLLLPSAERVLAAEVARRVRGTRRSRCGLRRPGRSPGASRTRTGRATSC